MVLNPAGYMLTSSGFAFIHSRYILIDSLKRSAILLKVPTSTVYFSNSTGSYVTNRRFFKDIDQIPPVTGSAHGTVGAYRCFQDQPVTC